MAWLKVDDGLAYCAKIAALAGGNRYRVNALTGGLVRLWTYACAQATDGFLPPRVAREMLGPSLEKLLTRPVMGRSAFLHRREDTCACLDDYRNGWADGAEYLIHDFMKYNRSKDEIDLDTAKQRERNDAELKERVARRDKELCRYCGVHTVRKANNTAYGRSFDHVNPQVAKGEDNLVTCCIQCNRKKGARTPEAAGMRLLEIGTTAETARRENQALTNSVNTTTGRCQKPGRDGTETSENLRLSRETCTTIGPPNSVQRSSRHPNPAHRSAITGVQPEHFAGSSP